MDTIFQMKDLAPPKNLIHFFERTVRLYSDHIALEFDDKVYSYQMLDNQANQLAHYLTRQGLGQNALVCILLDRSLDAYVSILAVLKIGAAYVPIEIDYPDERINHILNDLNYHSIMTSSVQYARQDIHFSNPIVIDELYDVIAKEVEHRPLLSNHDEDTLCYIIYTSGSTGKPKGVEITHRNICHYVHMASELYQMRASDKVYQGFSLAFDASLEEVWMAFANGATLMTCPSKEINVGIGLSQFLSKSHVTFFSTVPSLLSGLDEFDVPSLRLLVLGGEVTSPELIKRYSRQGLKILNTYGPTETSVIATVAECLPDKPITIGKPLPGYTISIFNEEMQAVKKDESGELYIGGPALARGYVNNTELTSLKFINHPHDKSARLYRTGDLVSLNSDNELIYLGRLDDQVKIRGFRVQLSEIEALLKTYPCIQNAVVTLHQESSGDVLAAYFIVQKNRTIDIEPLKLFLREKLPHFMMPSSFNLMEEFPLLANGKVNRKALPKPILISQETNKVLPKTPLEHEIAKIFEKVFKLKEIDVTADFFLDLGGHSLLAAQVVSLLRKSKAFSDISLLDLYTYPTIQALAKKFGETPRKFSSDSSQKPKYKVSALRYFCCGVGQFFGCIFQYGLAVWQLLLIILTYQFLQIDKDFFSIKTAAVILLEFSLLPIVLIVFVVMLKWLLLGRVKPGQYKLWGWFYFRFWLMRQLTQHMCSMKYLIDTPLINIFYRLLGAKIGSNCFIGTERVDVPDMLTIGASTSIGNEVSLLGYQVKNGWLHIGPIYIGEGCFIGARTVISPNVEIGHHAGVDFMTALGSGVHVPSNTFYAGSPAKAIPVPHRHILNNKPLQKASKMKTFFYGFLHYCSFIFVSIMHYASFIPGFALLDSLYNEGYGLLSMVLMSPLAALLSMTSYYLFIVFFIKCFADKALSGTYNLLSWHYIRHLLIRQLLNDEKIQVLADSLYFSKFLGLCGATLGKNIEIGHAPNLLPNLIHVDDASFIASSVAMAWPIVHLGQIRYLPIKLGKGVFLGNESFIPGGHSLGDQCFLGSMTTPPAPEVAKVGYSAWFGSPAMFLSNRQSSKDFSDKLTINPSKKVYYMRLCLELIRVTMPTSYMILNAVALFFALNVMLSHFSLLKTFCLLPLVECAIILTLVSTIVAMKWLILHHVKPTVRTLWDGFIRRIDIIVFLFDCFVSTYFAKLLVGTPLMPMLFRSMGAQVGKKTYIHTLEFSEFDLISIGDYACINANAILCTHLYEDRIFKTSSIDIQEGANVGVMSMVLYDTLIGKNASLGNLSILMKGEHLPENTNWQGLPAQSLVKESLNISLPIYLEKKEQALLNIKTLLFIKLRMLYKKILTIA